MDVTYAFSQTTDNFDAKLGPNRGWQFINTCYWGQIAFKQPKGFGLGQVMYQIY